MKKQDLGHTITSIQSKIEKLVHLHRKLADENQKLAGDKESLQKQVEQLKIQTRSLEDKNKILAISGVIAGEQTDKTELKLKINELVREIDRCIALLNR